VDGNKRRTWVYTLPVPSSSKDAANVVAPPPYQRHGSIQHVLPSPSGEKVAIFLTEEGSSQEKAKRTVLEIWTHHGSLLERRIPLPCDKLHDQVLFSDSRFGGVAWHPHELALVYVAERRSPQTKSFFDSQLSSTTASNNDDNKGAVAGGQYTLNVGLKEEWGEKFTGIAEPELFVVGIKTGRVASVDNVPPNAALGQPVFDPFHNSIVYTAWDASGPNMPRRLGSIYCYQRPSKIYASSVKSLLEKVTSGTYDNKDESSDPAPPCVCLTPEDVIARSPRFAPANSSLNGSKLAFLYNTNGFNTHGGVMGLAMMDWTDTFDNDETENGIRTSLESRTNLVKPVDVPSSSQREDVEKYGIGFPGLFLDNLPADCFIRTSGGTHIVLDSAWGSVRRIIKISIQDGIITTIPTPASSSLKSQSILCLNPHGDIFVVQSAPNQPAQLHRAILEDGEHKSSTRPFYRFQPIAVSSLPATVHPHSGTLDIQYDLLTIPAGDSVVQAILMRPTSKAGEDDKQLPLIVVPHGGPHSGFVTSFVPSYVYLCAHGGYAILLINFRGSTGYGQTALESLAGIAGTQDVQDVVDITQHALNLHRDSLDANRVGVCGGSHGGFLAGHLIGQHPGIYKVAALRNPVTNIATMVSATDIPDWCYVETLNEYDWSQFRPPTAEQLVAMWKASPVAHIPKIVAPTLVALGMADRRVPPSQGLEFYFALRSKNGSGATKLLQYAENDHAIDKPTAESDHWINIKQWFDKHL
jgi:acylaminoacyl-peptidase